MGSLSWAFTKCLFEYFDRVHAQHQEGRLLVPGLPRDFLIRILKDWISLGALPAVRGVAVHVSLAADWPRLPSEPGIPSDIQVSPGFLVAERVGSQLLLADPEVSAEVADSIQGSGGTVRPVWISGFPFSECEISGLTWASVLTAYFSKLGLPPTSRATLEARIKSVQEDLKGLPDRTHRFLECLDSFVPTAGFANVVQDFEYHAGFLMAGPVSTIGQSDERVLKEFWEELQSTGARQTAERLKHELANTTIATAPTQLAAVTAALDHVCEKYIAADVAEKSTPRSCLRTLFSGSRTEWASLSLDIVSLLYGGQAKVGNPRIRVDTISVSVGSSGRIVAGTTARGATSLRLLLRDPAVATSIEVAPWFNRAARALILNPGPPTWDVYGHISTGASISHTQLAGRAHLVLPVTPVPPRFSGRHEVRLTAGNSVSAASAVSPRAVILELCDKLPFVLVVEGADREEADVDPAAHTISVSLTLPAIGTYLLRLFFLRGMLSPAIGGVPKASLLQSSQPVPPTAIVEQPVEAYLIDQDQLTMTWKDLAGADWTLTVDVSVEESSPVQFRSITDYMVTELPRTATSRVGVALANLRAQPPRLLGEGFLPIAPPSGHHLAELEKELLQKDEGWWPILAPFGEPPLPRTISSPTPLVRLSEGLAVASTANRWQAAMSRPLPTPLPPELVAYASARERILKALDSLLEPGRRRDQPGGAANLIRESLIGLVDPQLILEYLEAYLELLRSAASTEDADPFLIARRCTDTVLLFDEGGREPGAALLGPFHPLNLARLHLLQSLFVKRFESRWDTVLGRLVLDQTIPAWGTLPGMSLQPRGGLALATGDPHWALLVPSAGEGSTQGLPTPEQLVWMTSLGIDPVVGPLGLDPRALQETIETFLRAYPASRSLTVRLLDESQPRETEERLLELLSEPENLKVTEIGQQLSGGVAVQDARGLGGVDAEYGRDPALYWFEGSHSGTADVAALARLVSPGLVRASGARAAISEMTPYLSKSITRSYPSEQTFRNYSGLGPYIAARREVGATLLAALASFEAGCDLALEWSLQLSATAAKWQVCSASLADPRSFVDYAAANPGLTLWSYRLFNARMSAEYLDAGSTRQAPLHGHFILAQVAPVLISAINTLLDVFLPTSAYSPQDVLRELGLAGLALGDDFIRSGRHAEGALGLFLCQRLIWQPPGLGSPLPHFQTDAAGTPVAAGFLLQLDPFHGTLRAVCGVPSDDESEEDGENGAPDGGFQSAHDTDEHADLMAFHLMFCPGPQGEELWIKPASIESKFKGSPATQVWGEERLRQARASANHIDRLVEGCINELGAPERALFAELMHLGLRLAAGAFYEAHPGQEASWSRFEKRVLDAILSGRFHALPTQPVVMIHHKGLTLDGNGAARPVPVFMVGLGDWDRSLSGSESPAVQGIRRSLTRLLMHTCPGAPPAQPPEGPTIPVGPPEPPEAVTEEISPVAAPPPEAPRATMPASEPAQVPENLTRAHARVDEVFSDFVGNAGAIDRLRYDLVDALIRRPPHLASSYLLTGNPSTGKTLLANKIAQCLSVPFIRLDGRSAASREAIVEAIDNVLRAQEVEPGELADQPQGIPEFEYPALLLFIDEVHLVPRRSQEGLLTLTEPDERSVRLSNRICRFPKATFAAATTRPHDVDAALKTRFSPEIHLDEYSQDEVAKMVELRHPDVPLDIRRRLATLGQNAPRIALRLARDLETRSRVSLDRRKTWNDHLEDLRRSEQMDDNGLTRTHYAVLRALVDHRGAMGLDQLLALLREIDKQRIEEEVLPGLQRLGLIDVSRAGRAVTPAGRAYFESHPEP